MHSKLTLCLLFLFHGAFCGRQPQCRAITRVNRQTNDIDLMLEMVFFSPSTQPLQIAFGETEVCRMQLISDDFEQIQPNVYSLSMKFNLWRDLLSNFCLNFNISPSRQNDKIEVSGSFPVSNDTEEMFACDMSSVSMPRFIEKLIWLGNRWHNNNEGQCLLDIGLETEILDRLKN